MYVNDCIKIRLLKKFFVPSPEMLRSESQIFLKKIRSFSFQKFFLFNFFFGKISNSKKSSLFRFYELAKYLIIIFEGF